MPVYGRVLDRAIPVPGMYVRLADPARRHADQHLASARFGQLNALDMEGAAPLVNDGCCDLYRDRPMMDFMHGVSPFPLVLYPYGGFFIFYTP
jgi:hypothetical protein